MNRTVRLSSWYWRVLAIGSAVTMAASACGTRLSQNAIRSAAQPVIAAGSGSQSAGSGSPGSGSTGSGYSTSASSGSGLSGSSTAASGTTSGDGGAAATSPSPESGSGGPSPSGGTPGTASGGPTASGGATAASGGGPGPSAGPTAADQLVGANCTPASGSLVTVGNDGTYSGVLGAIPDGAEGALFAWADYINTCGGLDGHKVKVISADDTGDPSQAISNEQKMVETNHVIAFVGDFVPTVGTQADTYLKQAGVPEVGGDGVSPVYYSSPMWYPVTTQIDRLALAAVRLAVQAGKKNFALFSCVEFPTVCSQLSQYVQANAPSVGAKVVLNAQVSLTQPSFAAQCQQAKSDGADAVMTFTDSASFQRAADNCASAVGFNPQWVTISLAAQDKQSTDPALQGAIVPEGSFTWVDNTSPAEQLYHKVMSKYAPTEPQNGSTSEVWASAMLLTVAASGHLSANPTPAEVIKALDGVKNNSLGGLTPPLTFSAGQPPPPAACYFSAKIVSNKWIAPDGNHLQCP